MGSLNVLRDEEKDKSTDIQEIQAEPIVSQESARSHDPLASPTGGGDARHHGHHQHFKVYKRRWFGLAQLVLLNIVASWDWLTFAAVSTTSSEYFGVSETAINWFSTGYFFSFCAVTPIVIWVLNKGVKPSIIIASVLTLIGNWVRYAGTRATGGHFGVVMFGQILTGFAQPFVLAAPTRFSDLWFTDHGRVTATAVASLANPLGGALGQLIGPFWASKPGDIPNLVLYVTIISSIASVPSFFIPAHPPTPPSASASVPKIPLKETIQTLSTSPSFWLIFIPFAVYVGLFNAISSLLNQILGPYGFSEDDAGICGALLIVIGLVSSAITSPIIDRTHSYLLAIKVLVPLIAASYLTFAFTPGTRTLAAPYTAASVLGASSFSLVPVALEYLVEVTFPASPEVGSTLCWSGGQLLGGIFTIVVGDSLKGAAGEPENSLWRGCVFMAVWAWAVVPLPLALGVKWLGLEGGKQKGRIVIDEAGERESEDGEEGVVSVLPENGAP